MTFIEKVVLTTRALTANNVEQDVESYIDIREKDLEIIYEKKKMTYENVIIYLEQMIRAYNKALKPQKIYEDDLEFRVTNFMRKMILLPLKFILNRRAPTL